MKNYFIMAAVMILSLATAQAQYPTRTQQRYASPQATTTTSTYSSPAYSGNRQVALGLVSSSHFLRNVETGFTGIYYLNDVGMIQGYLLLASTDPSIYGVGASYKHTVMGDMSEGFHVGGGLGFGSYTRDKTFTHINFVAGFHFPLATHLTVHIDTGLSMQIADSKTQMIISGGSAVYGLSLLYKL